jgi:hypothetical protein
MINGIVFTFMNGFRGIFALLVPLFGTFNEILIAMGISFWNHFCPEQDLGICIGAERYLYILFDFSNSFAILFELMVLQSQTYQALIFEFICSLGIYAPEYETFFCFETPFRHEYIEGLLANETFTYINQNVYDEIDSVMSVIASFAKLMVREGLDYFGRTLIFLAVLFLIILQYATVFGIVVAAFFLSVLTGIIYSVFPPEIQDFNTTTSFINATQSFTDVYDIMQTRLTSEILKIDPFRIYNESDFPCPPGVCELFENVLIQTNSTLYNVYINIPVIFMFADSLICGILNIHSCGSDLGICDFLFSLESGIFVKGISILITNLVNSINTICLPKILDIQWCLGSLKLGSFGMDWDGVRDRGLGDLLYSWGLLYMCSNSDLFDCDDIATWFAHGIVAPMNLLCETLTTIGDCPCWACSTDSLNTTVLGLFQNMPFTKFGKVPCNILAPEIDACCLSGLDYIYYDENCNQVTGSFYKSIFYYVYQLVYFGEAEDILSRKPLRCKYPIGYGYGFLEHDIIPKYQNYFEGNFPDVVIESSNRDSGPKPIFIWPSFITTTPEFEYLYKLWNTYKTDILPGSNIFVAFKRLLYSFTIGCYGPNFLSYHFTDLFAFDDSGITYLDWGIDNPYDDLEFKSDFEDLTGYDREAPAIYLGNGIKHILDNPPKLLQICPLNLELVKEIEDGSSTIEVGNKYQVLIMNSMIKQLREQWLGYSLYNILNDLSISVLSYKKRNEFSGTYNIPFDIYVGEIRPSILLRLLENNKWDLLSKIRDIDEIALNITEILDYKKTPTEFWNYVDTNDVCRVYTVDPGDGTPAYKLDLNYLYPDMSKASYFNYFTPPVHDELWLGDTITYLDHCARLLNQSSFTPPYTWNDFETKFFMFFNGTGYIRSDDLASEFMNNWDAARDILELSYGFFLNENYLEEISKQYLVVKVMKEKYFTYKIMKHVLDELIDENPCNTNLSEGIYSSVNFPIVGYNQTKCEIELEYVKIFLNYYIKHDPNSWYQLWIDDRPWPINICQRLYDVYKTLTEMNDYFIRAIIPDRYIDRGSENSLYAGILIWNFFKKLNSNSTLEWFYDINYDEDEAINFCGNSFEQEPRMGMELPKTECWLYMKALNYSIYSGFTEDFFDPEITNCEIVSSYLTTVFDFGLVDSDGDPYTTTQLESFIIFSEDYIDCEQISIERIEIQDQSDENCLTI